MGSETLAHKVGPNEDVRDLSGGDCNALINNYKESQLWLVLLKYSANVTSAFPWVVTKALGEDGVSLASFDPLIQDTKPLFGYQWKMKIVSLFNLFLLLFMTPLHFLILFIGHIILF